MFLVLIGPNWLDLTDGSGQRRIDNPDDFIRCELLAAFACSLTILPILVDGASLPKAADLPADLADLPNRQYVTLRMRHDEADLDHLVKELRRITQDEIPIWDAAQPRATVLCRAKT